MMNMEANNEINNRKVSVTFERKVSDGDYGGITARAWVEDEVPEGATAEQIAAALASLFFSAKAVVLDELGIPFVTDDQGVVREKQIPAVTRTDSPKGTSTDAVSRVDHKFGSKNHQLRVMNPDDLGDNDVPDWLVEKCAADGVTAVWYNGHKATGNQPHWRQALTREQRDADVQAKAYWPPR